jgi:peptidoglycan/xylan/chitin deacetylase (PgdA/CDA1 family)
MSNPRAERRHRSARRGRRVAIAAVAGALVVALVLVIVLLTGVPSEGSSPSSSARGKRVARPAASSTTTSPVTPLPPAPPPTPVAYTGGSEAPVYGRIPTTNRVIFLGIDDGDVRDPDVLTLIKEAHIPVTAFLVEAEAEQGAAYWKLLQSIGGVIEAHTITHPDLRNVGQERLHREVCGPLDPFQQLFGRRPQLFRPPYGDYNSSVRAMAASCGYRAMVVWKGSTNDGRLDMQEGHRLQPGDVLLLHWRKDLYENLTVVLAACRAQGFTIASMQDYLIPGE